MKEDLFSEVESYEDPQKSTDSDSSGKENSKLAVKVFYSENHWEDSDDVEGYEGISIVVFDLTLVGVMVFKGQREVLKETDWDFIVLQGNGPGSKPEVNNHGSDAVSAELSAIDHIILTVLVETEEITVLGKHEEHTILDNVVFSYLKATFLLPD